MVSKEIEAYAKKYSSDESDVLKKLNRETHVKLLRARMLAGQLQGNLLKMISSMIQPEQILEIGTFTAYSAICLASGLREGGMLHTIDHNFELEEMINNYIEEAGLQDKVKFYLGEALEIIPKLNEKFDLIYIDADKENYINYYEMVYPFLRSSGFIIADNVLWDGRVLDENSENDLETAGIVAFNKHIRNDSRVEKLLLPFRDGLMIIKKMK